MIERPNTVHGIIYRTFFLKLKNDFKQNSTYKYTLYNDMVIDFWVLVTHYIFLIFYVTFLKN